jgi:hypothetical protein
VRCEACGTENESGRKFCGECGIALVASPSRAAPQPAALAAQAAVAERRLLLEHGEWLVSQDRGAEAEPMLNQALGRFEHLLATPWVERLECVAPAVSAEVGP